MDKLSNNPITSTSLSSLSTMSNQQSHVSLEPFNIMITHLIILTTHRENQDFLCFLVRTPNLEKLATECSLCTMNAPDNLEAFLLKTLDIDFDDKH